jgi:1-acyl-sn-glycerol-3-phosphate acyltransferase
MTTIRAWFVFCVLLTLKLVSRVFFRHKVRWIGKPLRSFRRVRVVAALNHTSLYEFLYAGSLPVPLLWRIARHGVVPVADKTMRRPGVGTFFKVLGQNVVTITRKADETWEEVLRLVGPNSLVVIFPEGRMKRRSGLDGDGNPLVVRGGIADIIRLTPEGHLLLAYSAGLHHIQVPGQLLPKPFRTLRLSLEAVNIPIYREEMLKRVGATGFRNVVCLDIQRRRDLFCPWDVARTEDRPLPFVAAPAPPAPAPEAEQAAGTATKS